MKGSNRYVIIMAGGRGERFWPLSRETTPKQLLKLFGNRSLLQQAVDRIKPLVPVENVFVITTRNQLAEVRNQLPQLPRENLVAEPIGRDTCAAVTLGAALVGYRCTSGVMAVLPADHLIPEEKKFQQILNDAFEVASRDRVFVTIGIKPVEPTTGYGYIRLGEPVCLSALGIRKLSTQFFHVAQFVEKPDYPTAVEYVRSGQYRWNAGMFIWSFEAIVEGLRLHVPEMYQACERWLKVAGSPRKLARMLANDYPNITKISIDYALMEKAQNALVAEGDMAWDDLGSWPAAARYLPTDSDGNALRGEFVCVDSNNNLIYDARSKSRRTVITAVGVSEMIVVLTDDAVLVTNRANAQKVKLLVQKLSQLPQYKKLV